MVLSLALLLTAALPLSCKSSRPTTNVMLVGVSLAGVWADRPESGGPVSAMATQSQLPAARPVLYVGQPAYFALQSADVLHSFYAPELGIGPIDVLPGKDVAFKVVPKEPGTFTYYCTEQCGDPHYHMRGEILVLPAEDGPEAPPVASAQSPSSASTASGPRLEDVRYWTLPPYTGSDPIKRGKWLFERVGCFMCHGFRGEGGIPNFNSAGGFVPALDGIAERLELFEPEEAAAFSRALAQGIDPADIQDFPDTGDLDQSASLYRDTVELIKKGRTVSKKDPSGPAPPLNMPAWRGRLNDQDIAQIVAYLITLQNWDDEE